MLVQLKARWVGAAIAALFLAAPVHAQPPRLVSFQAALHEPSGAPASGPLSVTFRIYDAASGGSPLWIETHAAINPSNGIANVLLGSVQPLDLAFDKPYFVGTTIGAGVELTPRTPLASVPYALRSSYADALANPISGTEISTGTIPLDRLGNACATGRILVRSPTGWQCLAGP